MFQEALPAGIKSDQGTLSVEPGYQHRLIGKYAYSPGEDVPKDDLVERVKKMCVTTGANAAIIFFLVENEKDRSRAQGIEAVLVDYQETPRPAPAP